MPQAKSQSMHRKKSRSLIQRIIRCLFIFAVLYIFRNWKRRIYIYWILLGSKQQTFRAAENTSYTVYFHGRRMIRPKRNPTIWYTLTKSALKPKKKFNRKLKSDWSKNRILLFIML